MYNNTIPINSYLETLTFVDFIDEGQYYDVTFTKTVVNNKIIHHFLRSIIEVNDRHVVLIKDVLVNKWYRLDFEKSNYIDLIDFHAGVKTLHDIAINAVSIRVYEEVQSSLPHTVQLKLEKNNSITFEKFSKAIPDLSVYELELTPKLNDFKDSKASVANLQISLKRTLVSLRNISAHKLYGIYRRFSDYYLHAVDKPSLASSFVYVFFSTFFTCVKHHDSDIDKAVINLIASPCMIKKFGYNKGSS